MAQQQQHRRFPPTSCRSCPPSSGSRLRAGGAHHHQQHRPRPCRPRTILMTTTRTRRWEDRTELRHRRPFGSTTGRRPRPHHPPRPRRCDRPSGWRRRRSSPKPIGSRSTTPICAATVEEVVVRRRKKRKRPRPQSASRRSGSARGSASGRCSGRFGRYVTRIQIGCAPFVVSRCLVQIDYFTRSHPTKPFIAVHSTIIYCSPSPSSTSSGYDHSRRPALPLLPSRRLRAWTTGCASTPTSQPRIVPRRATTSKRRPMPPDSIGISLSISGRTSPPRPSSNRRSMSSTRRRSSRTRSTILKRRCSIFCRRRMPRTPPRLPARLALSLPSLADRAMRKLRQVPPLSIFHQMLSLICLP